MSLYSLARPFVFALDAERAHRATIAALKLRSGTGFTPEPPWMASLETTLAGLRFPNPIGLAAGFDKDAEVSDAMLGLGFGFVEVGTVTPRPQAGNPKPRLFRLHQDQAVINRMGFNNAGQAAAVERLKNSVRNAIVGSNKGVVGVNIGANKDSEDRIGDYVAGVQAMSGVADYITINVSSPNTPGLRQLQDEGALRTLLSAIGEARGAKGPPIFLKVAPDLGEGEPDQIVRVAIQHKIDAIIVGNTTVSRPPLKSRRGVEAGGLSGEPLKPLALKALREFRAASGREIPLIGVGGIANADDAWERIRAGASLIQLYTAMVYEGPGIARRIAHGLVERVRGAGFANIAEAVGTE
ncbi:MAG TPA: quinone-dependent dihydroorotate dehydrogenase [Sphingomicrobium sp.]|nr:quinone-dependent dihydroorotate dehydrogenase [Sphingomicrobium sp.]